MNLGAPAATLGAVFGLAACGVRTPAPPAPRVQACRYQVTVDATKPAAVDVDALCTGSGVTGFGPCEREAVPFIRARDAQGHALRSRAGHFVFQRPEPRARIHYHVDLEAIAERDLGFDVARRVGGSLLLPASTFLLEPEPLDVGIPVDLTVQTPAGVDFVSGLRCLRGDCTAKHEYALEAHEMSVATYSALGRFARAEVHAAGTDLELATLDGPLELGQETLERWVADSARAVAKFYGRFPAPHALVAFLPEPGRHSVVFGKLLPQSAPGVVIVLGEHADRAALYRDWILVHELFHIGFPSFHEEGKWLDEGSATYFEPLIRARAGWLTEREVWTEFARDMPQGLPAVESEGVENTRSYHGIYWGGAILCLLADVAAREQSQGRLGLEDGFRAVLAQGGSASQVWALKRVIDSIDAALGARILSTLSERHAEHGSPAGLEAVFERLGVRRTPGGVTLDDQAELAAIRHAVVFGSAAPGG